MNNCH